MKGFIDFLLESQYVKNDKLSVKDVYHTSVVPNITSPKGPTWFALDIKHAEGWRKSIEDDKGAAYTYKAQISGKIAYEKDKTIKKNVRR